MRQGLLLFEACCNIGSETQKVQMVAKTMVATFRKGNEGCLTCRDKNHLKSDCPKKAKKKTKKNKKTHTSKSLPLLQSKKYIGPKRVNLYLTLKENLFWKTLSKRPPRSPSTKTRGKLHLFPQTLNIQQCCCRYTSPK